MLEFFVIFSKSGIVLFATNVTEASSNVINGLIKHVFLEERTGHYQTDQLQLKYLMDNEFELVFVVGYQKFLQLSYVDKLLDSMKLAFRDKYSDLDLRKILNKSFNKKTAKLSKLKSSPPTDSFKEPTKKTKRQKLTEIQNLAIDNDSNILDFTEEFSEIYSDCAKNYGENKIPETAMRTFQDSAKSKKTIASMIVQPEVPPKPEKKPLKKESKLKEINGRLAKGKDIKGKEAKGKEPKGKAARQWDLAGSNPEEFDFSKKPSKEFVETASYRKNIDESNLDTNMEPNLAMSDEDSLPDEEEEEEVTDTVSKTSYFGSIWKGINYNKELTDADLRPVLDQLREHLTSKNVASQIAEEICETICEKLKGLHVNTWINLKKFARTALEEAILRILNPSKNINILREIQAKSTLPYVIVLCGVNGVGKSTNLAKIANWLIINDIKVLVVAGDTFRAGAIEQLRTHVMALKAIHERGKNATIKIELFDDGYNKDPDSVARKAIAHARAGNFNCVIVDTAGRMQDNEPLMKQLAKLIKSNNPDLTLFVGEALVGNEAVDQLTRFNNSLVDNGCQLSDSSRSAINGIVLTKFDTIDDQVGAAISMTYVTGKPIVFVGVGQTYRDLKQLDAKAVTKALMR